MQRELLIIGLVAALSACGGKSDDSSTSTPTNPTTPTPSTPYTLVSANGDLSKFTQVWRYCVASANSSGYLGGSTSFLKSTDGILYYAPVNSVVTQYKDAKCTVVDQSLSTNSGGLQVFTFSDSYAITGNVYATGSAQILKLSESVSIYAAFSPDFKNLWISGSKNFDDSSVVHLIPVNSSF